MIYLSTCGWCKHFRSHKSNSGFANGYWLGDGKCKYKICTVMGDTCKRFEEGMKRLKLSVHLR